MSLAEEIKTMLKRFSRRDEQPRSPEAQLRLVDNLEAMVEAWALELGAKFAAKAVAQATQDAARAAEVGKIETACEMLGLELTEERRGHLATLDLMGLQEMLAGLKSECAWPRH